MDAPQDAVPARSPPSPSPLLGREHPLRSPSMSFRTNDVGSDRFSSPLQHRDVVHTSVAALNGRASLSSSSQYSSLPPLLRADGGGFAADAERFPVVSDGFVDRFRSLHVDGGNGTVPEGSSRWGCTYNVNIGTIAPEEILGPRGHSIGPRPALHDNRRFAASPLLHVHDRVYEDVDEAPNGWALRRSAFEENVSFRTNAQMQCSALTDRRLVAQRCTGDPAVPYADGLFAHGHSGLHNERKTSFENSCSRGTRENNGMVSNIDFLQWQQRGIDLRDRPGLPSAQTSIQARPRELHCNFPVTNEQGGVLSDREHQPFASAWDRSNIEHNGDSLILRGNTLNSAQTMPHMLRHSLPVYNQQNNGQCDWGFHSPASARNMSYQDSYSGGDHPYFNGNLTNTLHCYLPVSNGQLNFQFDQETNFLASTSNMRNSELFSSQNSLIANRKPLCLPARSMQVHQREESLPQHDNWAYNSPRRNSDIAQLRSPDNCSLASLTWNGNNLSILCLAKDQNGCSCLQQMLDEGRPDILDGIYNGVIHHTADLMMDTSGNFLMQKLLETCNEDQRLGIILAVTQTPIQLVEISLNPHGTMVVRKLIETLKTQQQIELVVSALKPGFLELIKDPNGSRVVERCLVSLPLEHRKFIFDGALEHCVDIAIHRHGCCVLQRCLNLSTGEYQENLVAEISANAYILAKDAFGNYVVQCMLDLGNPLAIANVASQLQGKYVMLSTQKFSSNVVEKCLKVFREENKANIVYELLSFPRFEQLLQDPYANYVIKTALENTKGSIRAALAEAIRPHAPALRTSQHCRQIFSIIKK